MKTVAVLFDPLFHVLLTNTNKHITPTASYSCGFRSLLVFSFNIVKKKEEEEE